MLNIVFLDDSVILELIDKLMEKKDYKKATLVDWNQRIYEITLKADAYIPSLEDESLSTDANARSNQTLSGKVIDIIDNRFELTEESRSFLISDGRITVHSILRLRYIEK